MKLEHKLDAPLWGGPLTQAAKWAIHFPAATTVLPEHDEYPADLPRKQEATPELNDLIGQFRIGALVPGFPDDFLTRGRLHPRILFQRLDRFDFDERWSLGLSQSILGVAFPIDELRGLGSYTNVIPGMPHCRLNDFEAWDRGRSGGKKVLVPDGKGDFDFTQGLPLFAGGEAAFSAMAIIAPWWNEAERIQRFLTARQLGYRYGRWDKPFSNPAEKLLATSVVLCVEELVNANPCSIEGLKLGTEVDQLWEIPGVYRPSVLEHERVLGPVIERLLPIADEHGLATIPTGGMIHCIAFEPKAGDPFSDFLVDSAWAIPTLSDRPNQYLFNLQRLFGSLHGATPLGLRLVRKILSEHLDFDFYIKDFDLGDGAEDVL